MPQIDALPWSTMISFHGTERAQSVHVSDGSFLTDCAQLADRKLVVHECRLEDESELVISVKLKYYIVILSEGEKTWEDLNPGSYYDAIISNINLHCSSDIMSC